MRIVYVACMSDFTLCTIPSTYLKTSVLRIAVI